MDSCIVWMTASELSNVSWAEREDRPHNFIFEAQWLNAFQNKWLNVLNPRLPGLLPTLWNEIQDPVTSVADIISWWNLILFIIYTRNLPYKIYPTTTTTVLPHSRPTTRSPTPHYHQSSGGIQEIYVCVYICVHNIEHKHKQHTNKKFTGSRKHI